MPRRPPMLPADAFDSLADPAVLAARAALVDASHVRPLNAYARDLAKVHGDVPFFDPLDGGVEARLLIMLETPGPTPAAVRFVSRDNPTGTARNLRRFFAGAGIARDVSVIWNAVPWTLERRCNRLRAPIIREANAAHAEVPRLLALLPRLECAVLMGRFAGRLRGDVLAVRPELQLHATPHPSPTFLCTSPAIRPSMEAVFATAAGELSKRRANRA